MLISGKLYKTKEDIHVWVDNSLYRIKENSIIMLQTYEGGMPLFGNPNRQMCAITFLSNEHMFYKAYMEEINVPKLFQQIT